jgi:hypothetical protein
VNVPSPLLSFTHSSSTSAPILISSSIDDRFERCSCDPSFFFNILSQVAVLARVVVCFPL